MDIEMLLKELRRAERYCLNDYSRMAGDAVTALSTFRAENEKLRAELERMKKIMRDNGIMTIPPKYPGGPTEWNIPKPRSQKED